MIRPRTDLSVAAMENNVQKREPACRRQRAQDLIGDGCAFHLQFPEPGAGGQHAQRVVVQLAVARILLSTILSRSFPSSASCGNWNCLTRPSEMKRRRRLPR